MVRPLPGGRQPAGRRWLCARPAASRLYWHTQDDNARARLLYDKVARFSGFIRYEYPL